MANEQHLESDSRSDFADIGYQLHQIADRLQTLEATAAYNDEVAELIDQLGQQLARLPVLELTLSQTSRGLGVLTTSLRNRQAATSLQVEALIQSLQELVPGFARKYRDEIAAAGTRPKKADAAF